MNRSKLEMKVGLFVVLATALVVSGVLVLGGRSLFSKRVMAYTILDENVVGLTVGSPVRVSIWRRWNNSRTSRDRRYSLCGLWCIGICCCDG